MSDDQGEEAATLPCILVTSCDSSFKPEELIRQIIGCESLPAATETELACFPWTISNKYYTARVRLCAAPSVACVTAEVARTVQAFIVYFDSNTQDGLSHIGPWLPVVEDLAPEVLILACDHVSDGVARQEAQHWCLDHAFELVEMNPQELPDEDDDFPESTGVKRILQALNANVWSSVEMKDEHSQGFGLMSSLVAARHNVPRPAPEAPSSAVVVEKQRAESKQETAADDPMIHTDIQELAHLTSGDADVENFERLFTKLKEMKDKASSLPHEQRKVHAEKVAKAFWMAIGGDQAEIDGLSSGEES